MTALVMPLLIFRSCRVVVAYPISGMSTVSSSSLNLIRQGRCGLQKRLGPRGAQSHAGLSK